MPLDTQKLRSKVPQIHCEMAPPTLEGLALRWTHPDRRLAIKQLNLGGTVPLESARERTVGSRWEGAHQLDTLTLWIRPSSDAMVCLLFWSNTTLCCWEALPSSSWEQNRGPLTNFSLKLCFIRQAAILCETAKTDIKVCPSLELTRSPFELSRIFMWGWQTRTPNKSHHLGFLFFEWMLGIPLKDLMEPYCLLSGLSNGMGGVTFVFGTWKVLIWTRRGKSTFPVLTGKIRCFLLWLMKKGVLLL